MATTDLKVDSDKLRDIAGQLECIRADLRSVDGKDDFLESDFGGGILLEAVRSFVGGWKDGRKEITSGISGLVENLTKAADAYDEYSKCFAQQGSAPAAPPSERSADDAQGTSRPTPGGGGSGSTPGPGPGAGPAPVPGPGPGSGPDSAGLAPPPTGGVGFPVAPRPAPAPGPRPDPVVQPDPTPSPIEDFDRRYDQVVNEIDDRANEIDRQLDWIQDTLDRGEGDTEKLLARRESLLAESDRLERIRELLGPDPDPSTTWGATGPVGGSPHSQAPADATPVAPPNAVRRPSEILRLDPSDGGGITIAIGSPREASHVVVHLSRSGDGWDTVLGREHLGNSQAWGIADAAQRHPIPTRVADPTKPLVAVVSAFNDVPAGPGQSEPGGAGQISALTASFGEGKAISVVAHEDDVPALRDAIRNGAPIDSAVVIDGSEESVSSLSGNGVRASSVSSASPGPAASDAEVASPSPTPGAESSDNPSDDPFARLLEWIRNAIGGS